MLYEWERKQCKPRTWCHYTRQLLSDLEMGQVWSSQAIEHTQTEWSKIVWDKLKDREQEWWKQRIDSKPRLRTYRLVKECLLLEGYLKSDNGIGRRHLARIRSGANPLRIESGRAKRTPRAERKCWFGCDEVEDEYHFLVSCPIYADLRESVVDEVGVSEFRASGLAIMMGPGTAKVTELVIVFIQRALKRRSRLLGQVD